MTDKPKFKQCVIAIELYEEILYAQQNLNDANEKRGKGFKKKKWTFRDTSKELGKMLHSKRKPKDPHIMNFFD